MRWSPFSQAQRFSKPQPPVVGMQARKLSMKSYYAGSYIKLYRYIRLYPKLYNNLPFARLLVLRVYPTVVNKTIGGVIE
jgi:hypothetical protein